MIALAIATVLASADVDAHTREVLAAPTYAFCHDEDYPLTDDEAKWCPLLEEHGAPACPAFARTCAAPRAELVGAGRFSAPRQAPEPDAEAKTAKRGDGDGEKRERERDEPEATMPDLGGLAAVLFWTVIAAAALALVWLVAKNVAAKRHTPVALEREPEVGAAAPDEAAAAERSMSTDVEALLRAAHEAEARGELPLAIDLGHAALLRRLDHEGAIRLHRARTHGDYLVDLREHPSWREPVRALFREVDRIQFGAGTPQPEPVRSLLVRLAALARTGVASVVLLVCTLAIGLACDPMKSWPWRTSPSGNDGVIAWLEKRGAEVSWRQTELRRIDGNGVIVLLAGSELQPDEWDALRTWVGGGGRLVIAGRVATPSWVDVAFVGSPTAATPRGGDPIVPGDATVESRAYGLIPLVARGDRDYAIQRGEGLGAIVAVADAHLFTNAGLALGESARWLPSILGSRTHIELVDAWTGAGADTPLESIDNSHLTAAIAQLLLLILALYLWRGWPFGRLRDPVAGVGRGFADHARAMGLQYERARAEDHAAGVYSTFALETLRREAVGTGAGLHALALSIARRTGRDETEVMRVLAEIHGAAEQSRIGTTSGLDLDTVRQLARLLRETSRQDGGSS